MEDMKITDVIDEPSQTEKIKYFDKRTFEVVEMIRKTINIDYINRMGVVIEYNPNYPILDTIVYKTRDEAIHVLTEEDFNEQFMLLSDDITEHMMRYNKPIGISIRGYEHERGIAIASPHIPLNQVIEYELGKAGLEIQLDKLSQREARIKAVQKFSYKEQKKFKTGRK